MRMVKEILKFFLLKCKININIVLNRPIKIICGAGDSRFSGWISTNINQFNLLNENHYARLFKKKIVDNFLCEHVFEHIQENQVFAVIKNMSMCLKKGGVIRIAVPDGFFPDKNYIDSVKPFGTGPGAYDHKVLYNYHTIKKNIPKDLFDLSLIEYFDENGKFIKKNLDEKNGYIFRSLKNDKRNIDNKIKYTSLILDLKKK